MKKEIKRNIITKNANQTSKTAFKKMQNLNLTAMKKNKKNITNLKIKFKLHKNCIKSINKVMYCKKQFLIYITIKRQ